MEVFISSNKSVYKRNEPILLTLQLRNTGHSDVFVDSRIYFNGHTRVQVKNVSGSDVRYKGGERKLRIGPMQNISEAVRLKPGALYGMLDFTRSQFACPDSGEFRVSVEYQDISSVRIAQMGFPSVHALLTSNEITVKIL